MKILLIEGDRASGSALSDILMAENCAIDMAPDGATGMGLALECEYDAIVLALAPPEIDGIALCKELRARECTYPILLLATQDTKAIAVSGLNAGADDYILKPYDVAELMARIRALVRRGGSADEAVLQWADLQLDPSTARVQFGSRRLNLTPKEYNLLELFLRNQELVFSRSAIIDRLWPLAEAPTEAAVTNLIKDLRRKLKTAGLQQEAIQTVYGLGYRLAAAPTGLPQLANPPSLDAPTTPATPTRQVPISLQRALERYRQSYGEQLAVLKRLERHLQTGDAPSLELRQLAARDAHKLSGGLGILGCSAGSILARALEDILAGDRPWGSGDGERTLQVLGQLQEALAESPLEPVAETKGPSVLLVDDDAALAANLHQEAAQWQVRVLVAPNPAAARQQIAREIPDVILLDLSFPDADEDGLSLLEDLRQHPQIATIAFTARDSLQERAAVAQLGARGFLHKSATPKEAFAAISRVLQPLPPTETRVLIVDDDRVAAVAIEQMLLPWGMDVSVLCDSSQFWQVLTEVRPHLLLLDLQMPEFDGLSLCKIVRQDAQWSQLPIVMVSARQGSEWMQRAFTAGVDDFIPKARLADELVARVISRVERVREIAS